MFLRNVVTGCDFLNFSDRIYQGEVKFTKSFLQPTEHFEVTYLMKVKCLDYVANIADVHLMYSFSSYIYIRLL